MNNLSYRVYSSFMGWKLIGIKQEIPQVIGLIGTKIKEEVNAQYLVIEHNYDLDMDVPLKDIYGIEDFLIFKKEYSPKQKLKRQKL